MKNETVFKLINGVFSQEEATNVLTALFDYKIDYHIKEDFSNHIRFNQDITHSEKRIQELKEAKQTIKKMIEHLKPDTTKLVIKSNIIISFEK